MLKQSLKKDSIKEIGIDENGRLCITPNSSKFPYIWREAMEVHWNEKGDFLYSPVPREWFHLDWFKQITNAVEEQGYSIRISSATRWNNISESLKKEIQDWAEAYFNNIEDKLK